MSCDITMARGIDCKDTIGGLKAIFICQAYSSNILSCATITDTEMTTAGFNAWDYDAGIDVDVFRYNLIPNLSSMTVNINSDNANGTAFFEQTLSVTLQKIDHDMTNQLRLLAYSRAQIFVQDMNDNVFLLGIERGCHVTGGTIITGTAMGDLNGYTIEWAAQETNALIQLPASDGPGTLRYPFDGLSDDASVTITTVPA